ncbi:hypothetical protein COX22_00480 [Candidatus Falkowbacteria bacterium CG23_combo_of_CG06-09_8_20_14_all_49_15]|uniref:Transferrin-binding protein B C-lobe/N-lobe beta barrel domain-containing protein n=1 Tax=Candidatus Falkowbacteria bacterium CG23_combo_of_CG06-09_8_20_14_all_49_15 TaxID=1974572 RepID=A0A2G9ZP95_9BACT|nr:MAG: hypothetical protein COX22_00480 [Candidatus Falkowbacteria bacterium CG23_combo_of_CG06-09_8_20_14_all_49_15]
MKKISIYFVLLTMAAVFYISTAHTDEPPPTPPVGFSAQSEAKIADSFTYGDEKNGGFTNYQGFVSACATDFIKAETQTTINVNIKIPSASNGQSGTSLDFQSILQGTGTVEYGGTVKRGDWINQQVEVIKDQSAYFLYSGNTSETQIAGKKENVSGNVPISGGINATNLGAFTGDGEKAMKVEITNSLTGNAPDDATTKIFSGFGVYGGGVNIGGAQAGFSGTYNVMPASGINVQAGGFAEVVKTQTTNGVQFSVRSQSTAKKQ